MKHETGAQASSPEPHNPSHIPTPERKEERLTDARIKEWLDNARQKPPARGAVSINVELWVCLLAELQSHRAAAGRDEIIERCVEICSDKAAEYFAHGDAAIENGMSYYKVHAAEEIMIAIRALKKDQP